MDTDALIASYLSPEQMSRVRTFASTLLEWNEHMNLTGATTVDEVLSRHVADSLALIPPIEAALASSTTSSSPSHTPRILDVGSGAFVLGIACSCLGTYAFTSLEVDGLRCYDPFTNTTGCPPRSGHTGPRFT